MYFSEPELNSLSNVELFLSLLADPHATISIFHGEFQVFNRKVEKYSISCTILEIVCPAFGRTSNFGLEIKFCESRA